MREISDWIPRAHEAADTGGRVWVVTDTWAEVERLRAAYVEATGARPLKRFGVDLADGAGAVVFKTTLQGTEGIRRQAHAPDLVLLLCLGANRRYLSCLRAHVAETGAVLEELAAAGERSRTGGDAAR